MTSVIWDALAEQLGGLLVGAASCEHAVGLGDVQQGPLRVRWQYAVRCGPDPAGTLPPRTGVGRLQPDGFPGTGVGGP